MRRQALLVVAIMSLLAFAGMPARAGSASGVCTLNLNLSFSAPINNSSPPTPFSLSATGTCETTAQPGAVKSLQMGGSGNGSIATKCDELVVSSTFVVDILPPPAPAGTNGILTIAGTAAGAVMRMSGGPPTFEGEGLMVSTGLLGCINNGTTSVNFTGVLVFVDP
jgi:hypothetical protein